jgi:hypothetical protein
MKGAEAAANHAGVGSRCRLTNCANAIVRSAARTASIGLSILKTRVGWSGRRIRIVVCARLAASSRDALVVADAYDRVILIPEHCADLQHQIDDGIASRCVGRSRSLPEKTMPLETRQSAGQKRLHDDVL